jgi:hypothetical protein
LERQNVDETNSSESEHFSSIKDIDLKMGQFLRNFLYETPLAQIKE